MRKSPPLACARVGLVLAAAAIVVSGCANIRYDDEHANRNTRMYFVAQRMNTAMKTGGMFGMTTDIQDCYRATTTPLIKRFALQDCLSYDYSAYEFDKTAGRMFFNGLPTRYFEDNVAAPRWAKYGKLDGFGDTTELANYLRETNALIIQDLQRTPGSVFYSTSSRVRIQRRNGSL